MARLGELLVKTKVLTAEQVETAIRAQVLWGGRLGTNLIELQYIDLDQLANALSRQHKLPAALARHFEMADAAVQAKLPAEIAEKYSCVPLLRAGPGAKQIIIAVIDPLDDAAIAAIAAALDVEPKLVIQSVAGELRIRYHLERVYKIPRGTRFLRARGKTNPGFPMFDIDPLAFEDSQVDQPAKPAPDAPAAPVTTVEPEEDFADVRGELRARLAAKKSTNPPNTKATERSVGDAAAEIAGVTFSKKPTRSLTPPATTPPPTPEPPKPAPEPEEDFTRELATLETLELASVPGETIVDEGSDGRMRRRYVRSIDTPPSADSERSLGRIAIKKVQAAQAAEDVETPATTGLTLGEATRAIRRSTDRERVVELVCETLFRFMMSCEAALVLVIRGDSAISWRGFSRNGGSLPEVAVPLDTAGLVPRVMERCQTCRSPASDLGPIDQLLLVSLGAQSGELVIVPISIGNVVTCVIAMAAPTGCQTGTAESIAAAAGAAFARLMRNASR